MFESTTVKAVLFILRLMLKARKTSKLALVIYNNFSQYSSLVAPIRAKVAWEIHDEVAVCFCLPICIYCRWIVAPPQTHDYCLEQLNEDLLRANVRAEEDAAWDEYWAQQAREYELQQRQEYEADEAEAWEVYYPQIMRELALAAQVCPCTHTYAEHEDNGGGYKECIIAGCECREFGMYQESFEDPDGYDDSSHYVGTCVGDLPGGFMIYDSLG